MPTLMDSFFFHHYLTIRTIPFSLAEDFSLQSDFSIDFGIHHASNWLLGQFMILMPSLYFSGVSPLFSNFERQVVSWQISFIILLDLTQENFVNRIKTKTKQALWSINHWHFVFWCIEIVL